MLTTRPGHAEEIARRAAQSGEEIRIYACGGDGTLNEVANGAPANNISRLLWCLWVRETTS